MGQEGVKLASCDYTSHRADNEICDPAALEPFNTKNPSDVGSVPKSDLLRFSQNGASTPSPCFYSSAAHAQWLLSPCHACNEAAILVFLRSSSLFGLTSFFGSEPKIMLPLPNKGVSFPETNAISGGQLPGIGGQFETEWGVSLVRNSQPALCFLRAGGNLLLQPRATLRIVLSFEASVFVFFYQF